MQGREAERRREFEDSTLVHIHALYNMALKLTRNDAEAEDLLQDTFVRAFRFFDQFERGTNAKAWLFRILRNSSINRYRRGQRRPDVLREGVTESAVPPRALARVRRGLSDGKTSRIRRWIWNPIAGYAMAATLLLALVLPP